MTASRKIIPSVLALALLAACGNAQSGSNTPETAVAAETAPAWTVGDMQMTYNSDGNTYYTFSYHEWEDVGYAFGYDLITRVEYDTGEKAPICQVPGCEHDSSACLAYVDTQSSERLIAAGDGSLLVYHKAWNEESRENMRVSYEEILQDPERRETEYPGQAGEKYLQSCVDMLEQPSYLDRISADGMSRERLVTLPADLNPELICWDGNALYGVILDGNLDMLSKNYGVRISLDGQVDTFEIPDSAYTSLAGGWNGKLVLSHTRCPVDINTMYLYGNYNGFYALERDACVDCWLYDPNTGEMERIQLPGEYSKYLCLAGDSVVYTRTEPDGISLCTYDLATGESQVLYTNQGNIFSAMPVNRPGGKSRFVCSYYDYSSVLVELSTGRFWSPEELTEMVSQEFPGWHVGNICCETDDGRLVLEMYMNSSSDVVYATIPSPVTPEEEVADVQTSLQSVQEYVEQAEEAAS